MLNYYATYNLARNYMNSSFNLGNYINYTILATKELLYSEPVEEKQDCGLQLLDVILRGFELV